MALYTLSECAALLEKCLRENRAPEDIPAHLLSFSESLALVINGLRGGLPLSLIEQSSSAGGTLPEVGPYLLELLANDDPLAAEEFTAHMALLSQELPEEFALLKEAVLSFEFESACDLLRRALEKRGISTARQPSIST